MKRLQARLLAPLHSTASKQQCQMAESNKTAYDATSVDLVLVHDTSLGIRGCGPHKFHPKYSLRAKRVTEVRSPLLYSVESLDKRRRRQTGVGQASLEVCGQRPQRRHSTRETKPAPGLADD